jgi:NAD(P)H-hydrate epimerase
LKGENRGNDRGMIIIDADALNIIAKRKDLLEILTENVVLTPHPGEFERLSGIKPDKTDLCRVAAAKSFVKNKKLTLLLKGFHTVITNSKSENVKINLTGNPGMATAGSGDVLTGIIGAFLARGFSPEEAASCGAFIHGTAGDIAAVNLGETSVTSEEIIKYLGKAFRNFRF